jgi:hypothetical protein
VFVERSVVRFDLVAELFKQAPQDRLASAARQRRQFDLERDGARR